MKVVYFKSTKAPVMKHLSYSALFFCFAVLISCEERQASGPATRAVKPVSFPVLAPSTTPSTTTPSTTPANTAPVPVNNIVATTSKLNPAHGQPGHRCDISVGAPLPNGTTANAKPAASNPTLVASPAQAAPAIQPKPGITAGAIPAIASGINPAHGQPGHRCDVAVGSPIPKTAAPATKTTTSSPVITPVVQNTPLQPQGQTATTSTAVANGLNPAHGQPGHRCDIAVGKPLNSAPKKN